MESFDFKGFWWLPNNSSERLAGICRFTSFEGGELEIIGNSDYLIEFNIVNQPFIILGTTVKNGDITLYDCFLRKKEKGNGVFLYYVYVNLIFLGHHFYNDSNVKFNQISIHYSFINEWVNNQILDFVQSENAEEHIVNKGGEQLAQASIDNNYSLSININYGKSVSLFEKITIDRKVFITIDSSQERHYKDYIKIMSYTRNFLTLAITKPVFPLIMNGFISQDGVISVVRILDKLSSPANDILASKLSWHEMFFTFHDISDKFELFIKNWFDKAKDMATIYQLYCGVLENPNSYYPQQEFLSLIQSLESYCQKDINPELKTERINNPNFNRNLNLKIMSLFKSKTFQEIIKHLSQHENAFNVFLDGKSKNDFVNEIVKIRNTLSHGSGYNGDVYGKNFRLQIDRLKVIVEILLLKELGFDKETIVNIILRSETRLNIKHI
ncbi:MAG: HEPN domain-containing protein [Dolichospermum sp.]